METSKNRLQFSIQVHSVFLFFLRFSSIIFCQNFIQIFCFLFQFACLVCLFVVGLSVCRHVCRQFLWLVDWLLIQLFLTCHQLMDFSSRFPFYKQPNAIKKQQQQHQQQKFKGAGGRGGGGKKIKINSLILHSSLSLSFFACKLCFFFYFLFFFTVYLQ